jgi:hypothetical protein
MSEYTITRTQHADSFTLTARFLDCYEPLYNAFAEPGQVQQIAHELIAGAILMQPGLTANPLPHVWNFQQSRILPHFFWLTFMDEAPNCIPETFYDAGMALALGIALLRMVAAMRQHSWRVLSTRVA